MKKIYILICLSVITHSLSAQTFRHGLILSGGKGSLSGIEYNDYITGETQYKMNVGLGYKFRITPIQKPYFFDLDLIGSIKKVKVFIDNNQPPSPDDSFIFSGASRRLLSCNASLDITGNYKIFKGLYAGVGLSPSLCFLEGEGPAFDLPPVGKIGWNLKYVDIAIVGRMGLFNTMKKSSTIKEGRINDIQLQLFIPF